MKGLIIIAAVICTCFAACTNPGDNTLNNTLPDQQLKTSSSPETHVITISNMKFQPEVIRVKRGDTLVWNNRDFVSHCITEQSEKKWTSSVLKKDSTWKLVATISEDYFCALHQVMKGSIVVE